MGKLYFTITGILLTCSAFGQAARNHFSLSDTTFTIGFSFRARLDIDPDNRHIRDYHLPLFDSIANFMKAHPELVFAIESYTDQRGSDSSNLKLSQMRASFIKRNLVEKGVSQYNLAAVGMGESNPVSSQASIDAQKEQSKKEELYEKNRRYEFRIVYIYKSLFTLTDSTFAAGSVMRAHIEYDFSKATPRPESLKLIDSIARFLIAHPNLKIEIGGFTDVRGSDTYNTKLSELRVHAVYDRMVSQGVPAAQISYRGYGELSPLVTEAYILKHKNKDAQEEFHQLNRRTEIKIMSVQ